MVQSRPPNNHITRIIGQYLYNTISLWTLNQCCCAWQTFQRRKSSGGKWLCRIYASNYKMLFFFSLRFFFLFISFLSILPITSLVDVWLFMGHSSIQDIYKYKVFVIWSFKRYDLQHKPKMDNAIHSSYSTNHRQNSYFNLFYFL